jgi:hypothetical protein
MFRNTKSPFKSSLQNYYSTSPNIFISNSLSDKIRINSVFFTKNTHMTNQNNLLLRTKVLKSIHFLKTIKTNYSYKSYYNNKNYYPYNVKSFFKTKNIYNFIKSYKLIHAPAFIKIGDYYRNRLKLKNLLYTLNITKINYLPSLLKKTSAMKTYNMSSNLNNKLKKIQTTTHTPNRLSTNLRPQLQGSTKTTILGTRFIDLVYLNKSIVTNQKPPKNVQSKLVKSQPNLNTLVSLKKISNLKFLLVDKFFKKSYINTNVQIVSKQKLIPKIKTKYKQNHFLNNNQNLTLQYYKHLNPKSSFIEKYVNTYSHLTPVLSKSNFFGNTHTQLFNHVTIKSQKTNTLYSNKNVLITVLYMFCTAHS